METEGNSCVIIRGRRAREYFYNMVKSGSAEIVCYLKENEVIETQLQVLKAKKGTLQNSESFNMFNKLIDLIFKYNLYEKFGIKQYNFFSWLYGKICARQKL